MGCSPYSPSKTKLKRQFPLLLPIQGFMRSYFAGLLCVDWSPDSRFVVVGGQDDLITVWSMQYRSVICRGEGHRSWVSTVRFDPYLCPPKCNVLDTRKCSPSTSANGCSLTQDLSHPCSEPCSENPRQLSVADDIDDELMLGTYRWVFGVMHSIMDVLYILLPITMQT